MGNPKLLNFFITSGTMPTYGGMPPSWTEYVQTILKDADRVIITDQEKVIILNLDYFEKLSQLLLRTKPRVVANYLAWQSAQIVPASDYKELPHPMETWSHGWSTQN